MLTILHPEIVHQLKDFYVGIWPHRMSDGSMVLIIKCPKESILAAKITGGIRFYMVPAITDTHQCAGVMIAFFDDHDEPLTLTSPLFEGDAFTADVLALLSHASFDIHLFDENNHEMLGYRALNPASERFKSLTSQFSFAPFSKEKARILHAQMDGWFSRRTAADDGAAFPVKFAESLFAEDILLVDFSETANAVHGVDGFIHTTLERQHAGPMQEMDIVTLLQRIFPSDQIYLNPMRTDYSDLEYVDVLIATKKYLYLLQAKDSPNTEASLRRTIARKRLAAISQLSKAARQLSGAFKYTRSSEPMTITTGAVTHTIETHSRTIIGLIVLKEMFDVDAAKYTGPVLELVESTEIPCIAMEYAQLHAWTLNLHDELSFLGAFRTVLTAALNNGVFPRLRFGLID